MEQNRAAHQLENRISEGLLRNLHGEDSEGQPSKDVIVVVEQDHNLRAAMGRISACLFRNYDVRDFEGLDEALTAISGDVRERVALAMVDIDGLDLEAQWRAIQAFRRDDAGPLLQTPLVFVSDVDMIRLELTLAPTLKRLGLDALLGKPFDMAEFRRALNFAINARSKTFEEMEAEAKGKIIKEFVEHYGRLAPLWLDAIKTLSIFPVDNEDRATDDIPSALVETGMGLDRVINSMKELADGKVDTNTDGLSHWIHDVRNPLAFVLANIEYALGAGEFSSGSERANLRKTLSEICQFKLALDKLANANKHRAGASWLDLGGGLVPDTLGQDLEIPAGTVFCVIDDEDGIRNSCARTIVRAGGRVLEAHDKASLQAILNGPDAGKIDVFLLDHSLKMAGGGMQHGHDLISIIRAARGDDVLIIGHSAEAGDMAVEAKYSELGIVVVGKQAWIEIGELVRKATPVPAV